MKTQVSRFVAQVVLAKDGIALATDKDKEILWVGGQEKSNGKSGEQTTGEGNRSDTDKTKSKTLPEAIPAQQETYQTT